MCTVLLDQLLTWYAAAKTVDFSHHPALCSEFIDAEMDDYMNGIPDKQLSVDPEERNGHLPGHH
jgi:hypothetical protein